MKIQRKRERDYVGKILWEALSIRWGIDWSLKSRLFASWCFMPLESFLLPENQLFPQSLPSCLSSQFVIKTTSLARYYYYYPCYINEEKLLPQITFFVYIDTHYESM